MAFLRVNVIIFHICFILNKNYFFNEIVMARNKHSLRACLKLRLRYKTFKSKNIFWQKFHF
jgi:hypothetical protein